MEGRLAYREDEHSFVGYGRVGVRRTCQVDWCVQLRDKTIAMVIDALHNSAVSESGGSECELSKHEGDRVLSVEGHSGRGLFASGLTLLHGVGIWS